MTDIDRMFRSELAALAEQPTGSDLWTLDSRSGSQLASAFGSTAAFDALSPFDVDHASMILSPRTSDVLQELPSPRTTSEQYPLHIDPALDLFPSPHQPAHPLDIPFIADLQHPPQPTVHLSDVFFGAADGGMPMPTLMSAPIPTSASSSPDACLTDSPADSYTQTDLSSEEMDSDDFDLTCPSDPDFLPSPTSVNPAALSATSMGTPDDSATRPSRRVHRGMTNIPIPIPNFTRKSRGRKVPTSDGGPVYAASKDKTKKGVRTYTCEADGCGKCFVRGEHLKRHIRSIHTEEKPWTCTYENCNRTFSRRDNLNQHLRIHKLQDGDD